MGDAAMDARAVAMVDARELKRRNERLAEMFRTSATPRVVRAVQLRDQLRARAFPERSIAAAIADRMGIVPRTVRMYFKLYDANPAKYTDGKK